MQQEPGDEYLRRLANFIRANEKNLAESVLSRRRRSQQPPSSDLSLINPLLGWFGYDVAGAVTTKPVVLSTDTHRLFYILMRIEALGIDVGTLDVHIDNPSRPMSYINLFPDTDHAETLSLASLRSSLSGISGLSLGGGWWSRPEPRALDAELKYIYSSFTKLPALFVGAPGSKVIAELANEPPNRNALPLDAFKNLQTLECVDIDPRVLLGWDRLAESLRSLKIRKSGLEDVADIFIGAVVDDQARREGSTSRQRQRRIPRGVGKESYVPTRLPDLVIEETDEERVVTDVEEHVSLGDNGGSSSPPPPVELSSLKWAFLRHLSLSDNSLTFLPADILPYLTSLTHLDLSSNLLVSIPSGLGGLYNLVSLNLSDNMIDSVLGIYMNLGQVLYLNLSNNRLESICGLERLAALERIDLRNNFIEESAEIGRLAVLPNVSNIWIQGNPLTELEEAYRVACFDYFWKERKSILLDGTPPSFYEKRNLTLPPSDQMFSARLPSAAHSPLVGIGQSVSPTIGPVDQYPTPPSSNPSPVIGPVGASPIPRKPRKRVKRIVEFDGEHSDGANTIGSASHLRERSDAFSPRPKVQAKTEENKGHWDEQPAASNVEEVPKVIFAEPAALSSLQPEVAPSASLGCVSSSSSSTVIPPMFPPEIGKPPIRSRHSRSHTEFSPSISGAGDLLPMPTWDEVDHLNTGTMRKTQRSATLSRSVARRSRVTASVYNPPNASGEELDRDKSIGEIRGDAHAYRRKLEALKKDMGDGWLKVYSQSRALSP